MSEDGRFKVKERLPASKSKCKNCIVVIEVPIILNESFRKKGIRVRVYRFIVRHRPGIHMLVNERYKIDIVKIIPNIGVNNCT